MEKYSFKSDSDIRVLTSVLTSEPPHLTAVRPLTSELRHLFIKAPVASHRESSIAVGNQGSEPQTYSTQNYKTICLLNQKNLTTKLPYGL